VNVDACSGGLGEAPWVALVLRPRDSRLGQGPDPQLHVVGGRIRDLVRMQQWSKRPAAAASARRPRGAAAAGSATRVFGMGCSWLNRRRNETLAEDARCGAIDDAQASCPQGASMSSPRVRRNGRRRPAAAARAEALMTGAGERR